MRGLLLALLVGTASGRHASTSADVERILDSIDHDVKALAGGGELALDPMHSMNPSPRADVGRLRFPAAARVQERGDERRDKRTA